MRRNSLAGYVSQAGCGLNLLGPANVEQIHNATLEVLNDVGIRIDCEEAYRSLNSSALGSR